MAWGDQAVGDRLTPVPSAGRGYRRKLTLQTPIEIATTDRGRGWPRVRAAGPGCGSGLRVPTAGRGCRSPRRRTTVVGALTARMSTRAQQEPDINAEIGRRFSSEGLRQSLGQQRSAHVAGWLARSRAVGAPRDSWVTRCPRLPTRGVGRGRAGSAEVRRVGPGRPGTAGVRRGRPGAAGVRRGRAESVGSGRGRSRWAGHQSERLRLSIRRADFAGNSEPFRQSKYAESLIRRNRSDRLGHGGRDRLGTEAFGWREAGRRPRRRVVA